MTTSVGFPSVTGVLSLYLQALLQCSLFLQITSCFNLLHQELDLVVEDLYFLCVLKQPKMWTCELDPGKSLGIAYL